MKIGYIEGLRRILPSEPRQRRRTGLPSPEELKDLVYEGRDVRKRAGEPIDPYHLDELKRAEPALRELSARLARILDVERDSIAHQMRGRAYHEANQNPSFDVGSFWSFNNQAPYDEGRPHFLPKTSGGFDCDNWSEKRATDAIMRTEGFRHVADILVGAGYTNPHVFITKEYAPRTEGDVEPYLVDQRINIMATSPK